MKKLLALLAIPALLMLTACEGDSAEEARGLKEKSYSYRGEKIDCYRAGSGKTAIMTCDFNSFYREHDGMLSQPDEEESGEGTYWVKVEGKPLACVSTGSGQSRTLACDWQRHAAKYGQGR